MPRKRTGNFALLDTAFLADPKFMRLHRCTPDPASFAAALGVFLMLLTDARRRKSPEVKWEDWTEYADQIVPLRDAGVLTADGFDPVSFEKWAPAYQSPSDRRRSSHEEDDDDQDDAQVRKGTQGYDASIHISSSPISSEPEPEPPVLSEPVPIARARESRAETASPSLTDQLSNFDLTDPAEVWAYLFTRGPTSRQRDTYLASWVNSEGKDGTIELLHAAFKAGSMGHRVDPVAWIEAEVRKRKAARLDRASEGVKRRRELAQQSEAAQEDRRRLAVRIWAARGKIDNGPDIDLYSPAGVEAYIAKYGKEYDDGAGADNDTGGTVSDRTTGRAAAATDRPQSAAAGARRSP